MSTTTTRRQNKVWFRQIMLFTFGVLFRVKKTEDKKLFESIWHKIWIEEGYQETLEEMARYAPYSTDFVLLFGFKPCGTLRIVHNSTIGLPIFDDFSIDNKLWQTENIKEITLLTVEEKFRGAHLLHLPLLVLIRHLARLGKKNSVEGWVMMADRRLFFLLRRKKVPIYQIGQERFYKGSMTYPAYIPTQEFLIKMRKINPFLVL